MVKTIRLKLNYVIYGYTTLFITNLICLANIPTPDLIIYIPPRVDAHCQLSSLAVHWSYWKKTTHACNVKCGGLCQRIRKPSLNIIALAGVSVAYSSYHLSSFFTKLWFMSFHFSHTYEMARLLQNCWREF